MGKTSSKSPPDSDGNKPHPVLVGLLIILCLVLSGLIGMEFMKDEPFKAFQKTAKPKTKKERGIFGYIDIYDPAPILSERRLSKAISGGKALFLQFCENDKCSDEFNNKFNHVASIWNMNTTLSSDILVARVDCDGDDKWAGSFCTEQGVTKFPSVKLGMPFEQLETLDISKPESIYKPLDQRNISDGIMYTAGLFKTFKRALRKLKPTCTPMVPAACKGAEATHIADFMSWDTAKLDARIAELEKQLDKAQSEFDFANSMLQSEQTKLNNMFSEAKANISGGGDPYNCPLGFARAESKRRGMKATARQLAEEREEEELFEAIDMFEAMGDEGEDEDEDF